MAFVKSEALKGGEDEPPADEPRKRRFGWRTVVLLVALLLVAAEVLASLAVAAKLKMTVASKLDAELKLGLLVYLPPYGAWAWQPRLERGPDTLFRATRARVRLAGLPLGGDKPIVISSLRVNGPEIDLSPKPYRQIVKKTEKAEPPRKLSGMLQLRDVRFYEGRVTYRDPKVPGPPTVWDGLQAEVETQQQSPSAYTFHLITRAQMSADASAAGTIDVDSGEVEVRNLTLKARAEPEPLRSPLPQSVQKFLLDYRISGTVQLSGNGTLPLRDPKAARYNVALAVQDAMGEVPPAGISIDHAKAALTVEKQPAGPLKIVIEKFDVGAGGKTMVINAGRAEIDPAAGTWAVGDLGGHVIIHRGTSTNPSTARTLMASTGPSREKLSKFDQFEPAGRADFTVTAVGPLKLNGRVPWEAIEHEVVVVPRGASFRPKNFAGRIEDIGGGEVRLRGGMIVFQELYAKYDDDDLRLRSARLPLEGLPKLARWQEISGSVTFRQPLRRYTPKIDKVLDVLNPDGPFIIAGSYAADSTAPGRENVYDLIVSSDTGSFELTAEHIPLNKIRGDATITPAGVQLHALEADLLGGRVSAAGQWVRDNAGAGYAIDGEAAARDVDLTRLQQLRYDPTAKVYKGHLFAHATFATAFPKGAGKREMLRGLRAGGEVEMVDGEMFKFPVLKEILGSIGLKQAATIGDAAVRFEVADEQLVLRDAAVNAPALGLQGGGKIGLGEGGQLDLNVVAAPLADWRDKLKGTNVPVVSDVAGELAGGIQKLLNGATGTLLYQFKIGGSLDKAEVTAVPAPALTHTAAFVFGKMLAPRQKNQRPLEWFERQQAREHREQPRANAKE